MGSVGLQSLITFNQFWLQSHHGVCLSVRHSVWVIVPSLCLCKCLVCLYIHWKQLVGTKVLKQGDTVSYDTEYDERKGKYKAVNCGVTPSTTDDDRNGNNDPHLEVAARRLWDLCEKYWASSYQGKSIVISEMWSSMEDYCKASRCPDIYEVVRDCIWELVRGFDDTEDDEVLTMEEWSVFVRDTVHKHRTEAES